MKQFLKEYRINIILMLVLAVLSFWFNPIQEALYLQTDYEMMEQKSDTVLLWTMGAGVIILLFLILRRFENIREAGSFFLGMGVFCIPVYLVFGTFFLSGALALNRIALPGTVEKKYTLTFLMETGKNTPVILDFRTKKTLEVDKVAGMEKLNTYSVGDTVTISFRRGLLGFPFSPEVK